MGQYQGKPSLSVVVRDIRPHGLDQTAVLADIRLYERYLRGEPLSAGQAARLLPDREQVGAVYRQLRRHDGQTQDRELLLSRIGGQIGYGKVCCALDALEELTLIQRKAGPLPRWRINSNAGKQDLSRSRILLKLENAAQTVSSPAEAVS